MLQKPKKSREQVDIKREKTELIRRDLLLSISEKESYSLSKIDQYDRMRYLRELEGERMLNTNKAIAIIEPSKIVRSFEDLK